MMDKDKQGLQKEIKQVQEHMSYLESQLQDLEEQYEAQALA
jgi:uncharacterized coiled-coil protein SlyX